MVSERFSRLLALQNDYAYRSNLAKVGLEEEILIEGASKQQPGILTGRTISNHLVNFTVPSELYDGCGDDLEGRLGIVKLETARPYSVDGSLVRFTDG